LNLLNIIVELFTAKMLVKRGAKPDSAPLLLIRKCADEANIKEYNSIEAAIEDLESDPNVPKEKLERLKSSLKNLKNKTSIKIKDGEIIK
jgi:hypothetical protein